MKVYFALRKIKITRRPITVSDYITARALTVIFGFVFWCATIPRLKNILRPWMQIRADIVKGSNPLHAFVIIFSTENILVSIITQEE